ncbi:hypothetical protein [Roseateles chitinivorans]|nr:hypothetical protein [Roseateles chitinivorans]
MQDNNQGGGMETTKEIVNFYIKQMFETAREKTKKVCEANGIPFEPTSARDLRPIPVYEDAPCSLLKLANIHHTTTISWPAIESSYLQAYWKRRAWQGRKAQNEIVILVNNNYCWARFYAAKELMHCFMEDENYPRSGTIELVNDLIDDLATTGFMRCETPQTIVDEAAWVGAIEYLLPSSWTATLRALRADLQTAFPQFDPDLLIAQIVRVPASVVRSMLKHRA